MGRQTDRPSDEERYSADLAGSWGGSQLLSQDVSDELQGLSSSEDGMGQGGQPPSQHLLPHKVVHPLILPSHSYHRPAAPDTLRVILTQG